MSLVLLFRKKGPSMPLTKIVDKVNRTPTGGIAIQYSDGSGRSFTDVAEMIDFAAEPVSSETLDRIIVDRFLKRSPDASDDNVIEGKTFTYDANQNTAIIEMS